MNTTATRIRPPYYDERRAQSGTKRSPGAGWVVTEYHIGRSVVVHPFHHEPDAEAAYTALCASHGVPFVPKDDRVVKGAQTASVTSITAARSCASSNDLLRALEATANQRGA
jgi:hypothetical protein